MKQFKTLKSLLILSSSLSVVLVSAGITSALAGCSDKRKTTKDHECKKYPAWHINPSKPIPPKPVPPKPKKDPFKEILLKHHTCWFPFILDWKKELFAPKINDKIVRDYLIANLAPKLKYDYTKISFIGGKETAPGFPPIEWERIMVNDLTKITALFITTPHHHFGIDFWVFAQN